MTGPLQDVVAEGRRLVESATDLRIRLLGGVGVALHDHRPVPAALERGYGDLDVVVPPKAARQTTAAMTAAGYVPNERFNALHGAQRMLFYDTANKRQVDVFVGVFAMCHRLDLSGRLDQHPAGLIDDRSMEVGARDASLGGAPRWDQQECDERHEHDDAGHGGFLASRVASSGTVRGRCQVDVLCALRKRARRKASKNVPVQRTDRARRTGTESADVRH